MNKRRVIRRAVGLCLLGVGIWLGFGVSGVIIGMIGGIVLCEA